MHLGIPLNSHKYEREIERGRERSGPPTIIIAYLHLYRFLRLARARALERDSLFHLEWNISLFSPAYSRKRDG